MKKSILTYSIACIAIQAAPIRYTSPTQPTFRDYKASIIRSRKQKQLPESSTLSLILAAFLGTVSGYACRVFEKEALGDILLFRLANLFVWGAVQESVVNAVADDLAITTHQKLFKRLAWLTSWASYLLTTQ